jgi:hypothetical protein
MDEQSARVEQMLNRYKRPSPSAVPSRHTRAGYVRCGLHLLTSAAFGVARTERPFNICAGCGSSMKVKGDPKPPVATAATRTKPAIKATAVLSDSDDSS